MSSRHTEGYFRLRANDKVACGYCLLSFGIGENIFWREFEVEEKITKFPLHSGCVRSFRKKVENGNFRKNESSGNTTRPKKDKPKNRKIYSSHPLPFTINELILSLSDEQLFKLFIYCLTQRGLNPPLSIDKRLSVILRNMNGVSQFADQRKIVTRLISALDVEKNRHFLDIQIFYKKFSTVDMAVRLLMANEIREEISVTLKSWQVDADMDGIYFIFQEWIVRSFRLEREIPHKHVSLGSPQK